MEIITTFSYTTSVVVVVIVVWLIQLRCYVVRQCRIPELVERARKLKMSSGFTPGADLGPLITKESKDRVLRLIQSGVDQGAAIPLDGRNVSVPCPRLPAHTSCHTRMCV